jgi:hypothetical protein
MLASYAIPFTNCRSQVGCVPRTIALDPIGGPAAEEDGAWYTPYGTDNCKPFHYPIATPMALLVLSRLTVTNFMFAS